MKLHLKNIVGLVGILAFSFSIVSCEKDDTVGKVKVVYFDSGQPVEGATVKFTVDTDEESTGFFVCKEGFVTEKEYTTPSSGTLEQCFELPALISVTVVGPFGSFAGEGKLNLIEHETTSITVKLTSLVP